MVLLMLHSCKFHQCSIQASVQQALKEGQRAVSLAAVYQQLSTRTITIARCNAEQQLTVIHRVALSCLFAALRRGLALAAVDQSVQAPGCIYILLVPCSSWRCTASCPAPSTTASPPTPATRWHTSVNGLERLVVQPRLPHPRCVRVQAVPGHHCGGRVVRPVWGAECVWLLLDACRLLQGLVRTHACG